MEVEGGIDAIMASIRESLAEGAPDDTTVVPAARSPAAAATAASASAAPATTMTVDALVRSLLAPMLKEWLDAHLPEIVEKATHAEIRRLTGRSD